MNSHAPAAKLIPVFNADEVPDFATEEDEQHFWSTHSLTREYIDALPEVEEAAS